MKVFVLSLLVVLVFVFGVGVGDRLSTYKHKAVIIQLQGEVTLNKNEADRYARVIRLIRETTSQAVSKPR